MWGILEGWFRYRCADDEYDLGVWNERRNGEHAKIFILEEQIGSW